MFKNNHITIARLENELLIHLRRTFQKNSGNMRKNRRLHRLCEKI